MSKLKLALIYGGISQEREISLTSGRKVKAALEGEYEIKVYDPKKDLERLTREKDDIDLAFPILHGNWGEDGTIQGMLEILQIPYVGCPVLASSVGMDKEVFKNMLNSKDLPYPPTKVVKEAKKVKLPKFPFPWFIKPNTQGSSVGINEVASKGEAKQALKEAFKYGSRAHIERKIKGREFTCGLMEDKDKLKALPVVEIIPKKSFFDYEAKYDGTTQEIVPAKINDGLAKRIKKLSKQTFKLIKGRDFARVDFMFDRNNKPYILEINTIPGLTDESLLPKEAQAEGYSFKEFLMSLVENAIKREKSK